MRQFLTKLTLALFCVHIGAFAQDSEDETENFIFYDELTATISSLQKMTEGKTYKDADGKMFNLAFPETDFQIFTHDSLCDKATIKSAAKDVIEINEGIDFSKAVGLMVGDEFKDVVGVRVYFPAGYLKTVVVTDGVQTATKSPDYLEFYCLYGKVDENKKFYFDKMFERVWILIANKKIDKGYITEAQAREQYTAFSKGDDRAFRLNFPGSVLALQAQTNMERKNKDATALQKNIDYVNALADKYRFKRGLSEDGFRTYNPESAFLWHKKEYDRNGNITYANTKTFGNPYPLGPNAVTINQSSGEITVYGVIPFSGKEEQVPQQIQAFIADFKANVDAKYIKDKGYDTYEIEVPNANAKIMFNTVEYNKWRACFITFY
ncbi:hypothetical protein HUK80_06375 [Flavobacterium sp. MAH-1]|uniref:Uncharacterized protein n=1 Tax=Flavobacterium agri TaxID=2743471 RepID=A0A7Y8Y0V2_9FLAO|nr:hypothetical protein [Flavobacterium agri]NUY80514.1 hypothetical protein [Flavobacterium agri]NYA70539.1 hypothetical protein [Flavobacterium agri]